MNEDLMSLGYAAATFQQSPKILTCLLRMVGATPALTLNGIAYYTSENFMAGMKRLAQHEIEMAASAAKETENV